MLSKSIQGFRGQRGIEMWPFPVIWLLAFNNCLHYRTSCDEKWTHRLPWLNICALIPRLHDTTGVKPVVNRLYNRSDNRLYRVDKHPTGCQTGCQTGLTTGLTTVLNEQHVFVKPVWQTLFDKPVWQTRFDNRVERTATVRSTGYQTGLYNRFDNRLYTGYSRFFKPVVKRVWQPGLTTGWMFVYTIQPVVKPVW